MSFQSLEAYEQVLDAIGFGVVDSSFFRSRITRGYFDKGEKGRVRILDEDIDFYRGLESVIPGHVGFPDEPVSEFDYHTDIVHGRWAEWSFANGMPEAGSRLQRLMGERKLLSLSVFRGQRLEPFINEEVATLYLPHIKNALLEIASYKGVKRNYKERHGRGTDGLQRHEDNDAITLAKGVALSFSYDVCFATGDSDAIRMNLILNRKMSYFARRYGYPIPEYRLDILFNYREGFAITTHDGKRIDLGVAA